MQLTSLSLALTRAGFLTGFNPLSLFSAGEPGVFFDPSDLSTLFQDSSGTTPVTAVEQPVGRMLDKSRQQSWTDVTGAVWTKTAGDGVVTVSGNQITITGATTLTQVSRFGGSIPFAAGLARMKVRADWTGETSASFWLRGSPQPLNNGVASERVLSLTNSPLERLDVTTGTVTFTIISFDFWVGNHATQATATSRPVLSARINLLTKTEQFDNAVWSKTAAGDSTIESDQAVSPIGSNTADKLVAANATVSAVAASNATPIIVGVSESFSVYAKKGTSDFVVLRNLRVNSNVAGTNKAWFNLNTGTVGVTQSAVSASISDEGDGWYKCTITGLTAGAVNRVDIQVADTDGADAVALGKFVYIWGASLVPANQAHLPYQRVNTATDYDTVGFPHYLKFDGIDDSHNTTFAASLGTNCTIARAVPGVETSILTGQTVGTTFTNTITHAGLLAINRALIADETAKLTDYFNAKAGV